jgi:hypothetical protein
MLDGYDPASCCLAFHTYNWLGGFNGADVLRYYEVQAGLLFIYKQNMHGTLTSYLFHI